MGKITFASLKLKVDDSVKTFKLDDEREIEVKQYLPISDKLDLIDITLQKAQEGRLYNPLKVNMYYHLHLIYLYTNISFTDKQKEDEEKLYDMLISSGIIDKMLEVLPESEYVGMLNKIEEKIDLELRYNTTAAAILDNLVADLPKNAAAAAQIVENFDPEKFQAVTDFAKAANGGRDI